MNQNKRCKIDNNLFQEIQVELKMLYTILILYYLLGTLPTVRGTLDTNDYLMLHNHRRGNFSYWFQRCKGKLHLNGNFRNMWVKKKLQLITVQWCFNVFVFMVVATYSSQISHWDFKFFSFFVKWYLIQLVAFNSWLMYLI